MSEAKLQVCYVGPSQAWLEQNYWYIRSLYPDADIRGFGYSMLPRNVEWQPDIVYVHDRLPEGLRVQGLRRFAQWLDFVEAKGIEIVIGGKR